MVTWNGYAPRLESGYPPSATELRESNSYITVAYTIRPVVPCTRCGRVRQLYDVEFSERCRGDSGCCYQWLAAHGAFSHSCCQERENGVYSPAFRIASWVCEECAIATDPHGVYFETEPYLRRAA